MTQAHCDSVTSCHVILNQQTVRTAYHLIMTLFTNHLSAKYPSTSFKRNGVLNKNIPQRLMYLNSGAVKQSVGLLPELREPLRDTTLLEDVHHRE